MPEDTPKKRLMEDLQTVAEELNESPTMKQYRDNGDYSVHKIRSQFGSWNDAVREAGFSPRSKGTGYGARPDACPLCGAERTGLDFHHWRYGENERGCYLCRDCHDAVHAGDAGTENPNWLLHCISNLVTLHVEHHIDDVGADAIPNLDDEGAAASGVNIPSIIDRYNMPENPDLVATAIRVEREP